MKAYRIEGRYSQAIFYVGYRKDVEETLSKFFEKHADGVKSSKGDPESVSASPKLHPQPQTQPNSSQTYSPSLTPPSHPPSPKHISLHILLFDLTLTDYNSFKQSTTHHFTQQIKKYPNSLIIHFAIVQSRQQSLRYIKKIEKYTQPQFETNLNHLNKELEENAEYDLVRDYLMEKFEMKREEVFSWMQETSVRTFKELVLVRNVPTFWKKELRQLLGNLTLLEELYHNQEEKQSQSLEQTKLDFQ